MSQEFADAIQDETIETDPPPAGERETYEELVEVKLSAEDIVSKHERLETVDRELVRLDTEKKAAAKVFTNQIKPLQAERESILDALAAGTEKRHVEVYEHFDERLGKVEVRRVDTDEVIEERAMTAQEREDAALARQGDLFDGGGSQPPPADDVENNVDDPHDLEPTPEALAQAAEDTGRVVRTNAAEVRKKRASKKNGAAGTTEA
jgi:hypothetical protein